jgi:hypothetical protein
LSRQVRVRSPPSAAPACRCGTPRANRHDRPAVAGVRRSRIRPRRGTPAARAPHGRSSTWSQPTASCGSSPCCTVPGQSCSTSVSRAASTSLHGQTGFSGSTPNTSVRGSFGTRSGHCSTAVLIRPDGYVAGAGDPTQPGLADALTTWFGPAI